MRILYIGDTIAHDAYIKGELPSHFLYGACEMEKDGHYVIWEQETYSIINDIKLVLRNKPDIIFIPNLNFSAHYTLLFLESIGLISIPIYAYLHREPRFKQGVKGYIYKLLLSGVRHLFFLSEKTMADTIRNNQVNARKCSMPEWGADLYYYQGTQISDGGYFLSTGKENRDFDMLIEAFKNSTSQLKIITARTHAGSNYEFLIEKCMNIPNIEAKIIENTGDVYPILLKEMAHAHALVCPIKRDKLTYCVGLSSIVDAEVLNKPLIITRNPYHSKERTKHFTQVSTLEEWKKAIEDCRKVSKIPVSKVSYTMNNVYIFMKEKMGL